MAVLHKDGPRSEIEYRLAWARTYLKGIGALDNPERGVWVTTALGKKKKAAVAETGADVDADLWLLTRRPTTGAKSFSAHC